MTRRTDYVVRAGAAESSAAQLGGKGRNLALLTTHGLRVPPWFALTADAFEALVGDARPQIDRLASTCAAGADPAEVAAAIRRIIETAPLPPGLEEELHAALRPFQERRDEPDLRVAVRSSAVDEDSADHSFAGQLDSELFLRPDATVLDAIRRVFASAFGANALAYRVAKGLPLQGIRAAVIVQEMIEGDVSGVAFTGNPINANPEQLVVNAVYGAGEGLVSGELDCDSWVLDSRNALVRSEIRDKPEQLVFDAARGAGTTKVPVPEARRRAPSLSSRDLENLALQCRTIEQEIHGGVPQDIEWCLRKGELFILQARPITAFSGLRKQGPCIVFDNSNVVESYACVPSPMTFSFASASFRATFRGVLVRLGLPARRLRELDALFTNMLVYVDGRMAYNLLNWYRYLWEIPTGGDNTREFDRLIGIAPHHAVERPPECPAPDDTLITPGRVLLGLHWAWKRATIGRIAKDFGDRFERNNGQWLRDTFEGRTNHELLAIYRQVFESCSPDWDAEIVNFIGAQRGFAALRAILDELALPNAAAIENDLVGGDGGIASMRPMREMIAIADLVRDRPEWREAFQQRTPEDLARAALGAGEPLFAPLRPRLEKFLDDYGCRCMNELKLEEPTLLEDPSFLFATVKAYVAKPPPSFEKQLEGQQQARARAEALVYAKAGWRRRVALKLAIDRVRRHVYYREELRLIRGKYWGIVRRLVRAMGRNFAKAGLLAAWDDIFLLKIDEVAELIEGRSPDLRHVRELVELRRRARDENLEREAPSRIYSYGDACARNFSPVYGRARPATSGAQEGVLHGIACGPGVVRARARVVHSGAAAAGMDGEVLVAERTDPGWIPLYPSISGLVIERGSVLSHSAVVAREMGIPTVVGVTGATRAIRTNDEVVVDGSAGTVTIIRASPAAPTGEAA